MARTIKNKNVYITLNMNVFFIKSGLDSSSTKLCIAVHASQVRRCEHDIRVSASEVHVFIPESFSSASNTLVVEIDRADIL